MSKLLNWFMSEFIVRYEEYKKELKRQRDFEDMRRQQEEIDMVLGYKSDD